ncbi:unnamed protein product [Cylindrotheca closterium]|uniref:Uncharacterized protein n=1 Tax=Cylindrotheca closterium TaxID=2856 RepID=A0AAD2JKA6_9STRA|nr:unnamed protein product [Cylindrotheca closterium]
MQSSNNRPSPSKRQRMETSSHDGETQSEDDWSMFRLFQELLLNGTTPQTPQDMPMQINPSSLPKSLLQSGQLRNNISKWSTIFVNHGFRTSLISSPRQGISVYKDSFALEDVNKTDMNGDSSTVGRIFLVAMFALHPHQEEMEKVYKMYLRNLYSLFLFCQRMRQVSRKDGDQLEEIVREEEKLLCGLLLLSKKPTCTREGIEDERRKRMEEISASIPSRIPTFLQEIHNAHPQQHRIEVLEHEYQRICSRTSTLSNALVTLFQSQHQSSIDNMVFKASPSVSKYERIAIYLYDAELDHKKPPHFLFLPSLHVALTKGPGTIVETMMDFFWSQMLNQGYYATLALKRMLHNDLANFFRSGLTGSISLPLLQMHAHFAPTAPLSLYLYGKAGSGKSSLVRNFPSALEATIERFADSEMLVRFVKQNLNKKHETLELELELRPNNNDLSVMSIIQGRRMTMGQSKPGLVVVNLEEMPNNEPAADPNQLQVAKLISQRFGGRTGDYNKQSKVPRNSEKRGIQNDASLVTLFTSNYILDPECLEAMKRLPLFNNLSAHEIVAVSGADRMAFAQAYLQNCVNNHITDRKVTTCIEGTMQINAGDTRPIVRHLRMLAAYIGELVPVASIDCNGSIQAMVKHVDSRWRVQVGTQSLELQVGPNLNLYPTNEALFEFKRCKSVNLLRQKYGTILGEKELHIILNFWLSKTLAPAVIVSNKHGIINRVLGAVRELKGVTCFTGVDSSKYKMTKSLYDPRDTPNLRDDILKVGRGATVAVELNCPSSDSQLCIREMIEDSPSMTAFSTSRSALHKEGLLFLIHVTGTITPEVKSRASIIL